MNCITLNEEVMVSDPCYSDPTWCQVKLKDVLPGGYLTTVRKTDDPSWGNRCSVLLTVHEDYVEDTLSWRNYPGKVGVDSGQAGIFCMTSYRNDEVSEGITTPESDFVLPYNDSEGDKWYDKMCNFTLSKDQWGMYDTGVVTSSGIGDGMYPMEVMMDKEKIVGIRITYLGNSDKELLDEGDCCGVCGGELEPDGECVYCCDEETN